VGSRLGGWLVAAAAALVILGASIAPFLMPAVVRFEQDRVGVGALVGADAGDLDLATGSLLADLVLWRGDFHLEHGLGAGGGNPLLLNDAERTHMRDVRDVFTGFWILVLAGVVVLAVAFRRARSTEARSAAWRSIALGARALAVVLAVLGAFAVLAFDVAFELFHRLFFNAGSYTFDPATSVLVRLFPDQFWSDITLAVGVVAIALAIAAAWFAGRRAARAASTRAAPVLTATRAGT
jgi:integral membrane protein (TIGR01906 family)